MNKIKTNLNKYFEFKSYFAVISIIICIIGILYVDYEMNDKNFIFDIFQKIYLMPFKLTLIFSLVLSIFGFVSNSKYFFYLNNIGMTLSLIIYSNQWFLIIILIALYSCSAHEINNKNKLKKELLNIEIVSAYIVEKNLNNKIDVELIKQLSYKKK